MVEPWWPVYLWIQPCGIPGYSNRRIFSFMSHKTFLISSHPPCFGLSSWPWHRWFIYIYKVVISVCFFVCMSDHNSGTPWSIGLKFWLGNSGEPWECSLLSFKIISLVGQLLPGKIANISMYDQARVNSRSNYKFRGQRRVPTLVGDKIVTGLPTKIESIKDDCTECIWSVSLKSVIPWKM